MGAESGPILTLGSLAVDGIWASPAVLHVRAQVLFFSWFMILTWTFVNVNEREQCWARIAMGVEGRERVWACKSMVMVGKREQ